MIDRAAAILLNTRSLLGLLLSIGLFLCPATPAQVQQKSVPEVPSSITRLHPVHATVPSILADTTAYMGETVELNQVKLIQHEGDRALRVGSDEQQSVEVLLPSGVFPVYPSGRTGNLRQGQLLNVTGVVEKAPPEEELKKGWRLSRDIAEATAKQGVAIRAISVVQQPNRP